MTAKSDQSQARRPWRAPAWAAFGVALSLLVWGCLNPWPDDYPSSGGTTAIEPPPVPTGEDACRDNPLARDCDDTGGNDDMGGNDVTGEPGPDDDDEPDSLGVDPVRDAGADANQSDGGAPDAAVMANE